MKEREMSILSVDWDYFFPSSHIYDWGHGETTGNNTLYGHLIWSLRYHNRSLYEPENEDLKACNYYWPNELLLKDFWRKTVRSAPEIIILADSHLRLAEHIGLMGEKGDYCFDRVVNYDAHHDYGYPNNKDHLIDCGNWARIMMQKQYAKQYKLHYPPWRWGAAEDQKSYDCVKKASYVIQREPQDYAVIFICQSRSWCPPWADNRFTFFVNELLTNYGSAAELYQMDEVMTAREFEPGPDMWELQKKAPWSTTRS